jgi:hypothetical protein
VKVASTDFQRASFLLSDHADVLVEWVLSENLKKIIKEETPLKRKQRFQSPRAAKRTSKRF